MIARWELLAYYAGHPAPEGFVLKLVDKTGRIGLGEARTIDGYGSGQRKLTAFFSSQEHVQHLLLALQAGLTHQGPEDFLTEAPVEARFAAETALYDLASRQASQDLTSFLGYRPRACLANSLLVEDESQARRLASEGHQNFKLKANGNSAAWVSVFDTLLRDTAGRARIRIDANGSWDIQIAMDLLNRVSLENLDYLEQPFPVGDLDSCRQLKDHLDLSIGLDEGVETVQDVEDIARLGAAEVIVIKPMFRGLLASLDLARAATSQGLEVCFTHSMDGTIGRLAAMHLAAALGTDRPQGLYAPGLPQLAAEPELGPDTIFMPRGPGLGWRELREDALTPWTSSP